MDINNVEINGASGVQVERKNSPGRIALLAAGDTAAFLLFAAIGRGSHDEANTAATVVLTAAPFLVAWFIVSPFVGAFRRDLSEHIGKMAIRTLLSWLVAWPIALLLRGILKGYVPPLTFVLIALIANTIILLTWRSAFVYISNLRKH